MKKLSLIGGLILCLGMIQAQSTLIDSSFHIGSGPNGIVFGIDLQIDGKILIGGEFSSVSGTPQNRISRLMSDGTIDNTFMPTSGPNNTVSCFAIQPDGKIMVGGSFTQYDGVSRNKIARINEDGTLDTTFNPQGGFDGRVLCLALQNDGKIVVGGAYSIFNGQIRNCIARLNSDGSEDTTFHVATPGFDISVNALGIQNDGKILAGGIFYSYDGIQADFFLRLNEDGTRDTLYPGAGYEVYGMEKRSNGGFTLTGCFGSVGSELRSTVAKLNADGTVDSSFIPTSGATCALTATELPNGRVVVGGVFDHGSGSSTDYLSLYNDTGRYISNFAGGHGTDGIVYIVKSQPDGKVLVGGSFSTLNYENHPFLTRMIYLNCLDTIYETIDTTGCRGFELYGHVYTESGNYSSEDFDSLGCYSIRSIHFEIDSLNPGPVILSESGNVYRCGADSASFGVLMDDSTYTYQWYWAGDETYYDVCNGSFNEVNFNTDTMTITDIEGGQYYGYYVYCLIEDSNGCITRSANDTIFYGILSERSDTICAGDSILVGEQYYSNAGYYSAIIQNYSSFCDTVLHYNLYHYPSPLVAFAFADSIICQDQAPLNLVGTPAGGTFSGLGVMVDQFDPSLIDSAQYVHVNYVYTDSLYLCQTTVTDSIFVDICTENQTIEIEPHMMVYPNPNDGHFYIKQNPQGVFRVDVVNTFGQCMLSKSVTENQLITLQHCPAGVYWVYITGKKNTFIEKVVVE